MGLNVFETKTVQKVCINGVLDTEFLKIFALLSATFSRGQGSLLVVRWVGCLGNKPSKRIPLGTRSLINFLSEK